MPGASQAGALAHKTQLNHDKLSATITVAPHQRSIRRKIVIVRGSLKKIVVKRLGVEAVKVTESASFIDDLGADSFNTVQLVMAFEEEFSCEIQDDAAETILTLGDAVKFLEKKLGAWPGSASSESVRKNM